jgi:hypothetical protein
MMLMGAFVFPVTAAMATIYTGLAEGKVIVKVDGTFIPVFLSFIT